MGALVIGLGIALAISWIGVRLIRRWAEKHLLDIPNERSSHTRPVPRGGGAAIVGVVIGGLCALMVLDLGVWTSLWPLVVGGLLIAVISWLDDMHTLSTRVRFVVHAGAVILPLVVLGYWDVFTWPLIGALSVSVLGFVLAMLWGIGLTNAYNFMDGIDGIAAVQAIAAGLGWVISGIWLDAPAVTWTGGLLAASALGFLPHNWSPARIFMGDVGSAFCGYVLSMIALVAYTYAPADEALRHRIPFAALAFVWPFVFDAGFTLLRRLKNGENIFAAHRSHLYQRLVIAGQPHAHVSLIYFACALVSTVAGLYWLGGFAYGGLALVVTFVTEGVLLLAVVLSRERMLVRDPA